MAFKEYSVNDFLYSGFDISFCANKTNIELDDLIDSSCRSYGTVSIDVSLNDITYQVTPNTTTLNTIKEIADEFTKKSPYIFSYNAKNELTVEYAKINFATAVENSASKFLGYEESDVNHKLPYMFPNAIKTTYNDDKKVQEYNFDSSYNFGPDADIRANLPNNSYYELISKISINTAKPTNERYMNPYSLIEHLNHKKFGFAASASPVPLKADTNNKLYYKFEYVSMYDKLKVDLMCQETLSKELKTITIADTVYKITIPYESSTDASKSSSIVFDDSFRYWKTGDKKKIINRPKITYQKTITSVDTIIMGVFNATKKAFVCNLPDFAFEFKDAVYGPTLVYSASKYVKYNGKYHTLPYIIPDGPKVNDGNTSSGCNIAKQNRALCTNKAYADKLMALTGTHPGASERYDNIRSFTNMSILNIFNLGIGIVATGVFIAQTYK
jgi:hypothetical protein